MVGRLRLIFWRWAVRVHDQLHEAVERPVGGSQWNPDDYEWTGEIPPASVIELTVPPTQTTTSGHAV